MQPKLSFAKAAAIGAALALIAIVASRAVGNTPADNNSVSYWGGVALGGALLAVAIAAIINRGRR